MLYHYSVALKATVQPAILRNRVQKSLDTYPENTILLALFLESERARECGDAYDRYWMKIHEEWG